MQAGASKMPECVHWNSWNVSGLANGPPTAPARYQVDKRSVWLCAGL